MIKIVEYLVLLLVVFAAQSKLSNGQTNLYQKEPAIIQSGSRPIERLLYLEDEGVHYQCVQKCYPIAKPPPADPVTEKPLPPIVEPPPQEAPPIRALKIPTPVLKIQPTKLPQVVPITYCQLMCLRYPYSEQCARCKRPILLKKPDLIEIPTTTTTTTIAPPTVQIPNEAPPVRVQPPPQVIFNTMRCCYLNHCTVLPIQPTCPSICYEPCDAMCTGRCQTNPRCPNKCAEVSEKLREYKIKFMIWLHAKLDAIKLTHRQMVEECIMRTRSHYVASVKALQSQIKAAHPLLFTEQNNIPGGGPSMRRAHGIQINILGQQNVGGQGGSSEGSPAFHVNQNIGISNNDPGEAEVPTDAPGTETTTAAAAT